MIVACNCFCYRVRIGGNIFMEQLAVFRLFIYTVKYSTQNSRLGDSVQITSDGFCFCNIDKIRIDKDSAGLTIFYSLQYLFWISCLYDRRLLSVLKIISYSGQNCNLYFSIHKNIPDYTSNATPILFTFKLLYSMWNSMEVEYLRNRTNQYSNTLVFRQKRVSFLCFSIITLTSLRLWRSLLMITTWSSVREPFGSWMISLCNAFPNIGISFSSRTRQSTQALSASSQRAI